MSGTLFVISAPSGAGKTSLVHALLEREPAVEHSISCTTRLPRPGEQNGVDYHFVTVPQFLSMRSQGAFLESAEVHGNYYGTPWSWIEERLKQGLEVLMEIDWQGALQVIERIPDAIKIFILPPSLQELQGRLEKRAKDSPEVIQARLAAAGEEISHAGEYHYLVLNQDLSTAVEDLLAIVRTSRLTQKRQMIRYSGLIADLTGIARTPGAGS